jgi:predicted phage terminase large subunit-like protein
MILPYVRPEDVDEPEGENIPDRVYPGTALWRGLMPEAELDTIRRGDSGMFEMMYQGNSHRGGAGLFPRTAWRREPRQDHSRYVFLMQSWDTALGDGDGCDEGGCLTLGVTLDGRIGIRSAIKGRWDFPALLALVGARFAAERPHLVLVEDAGSGKSLYQTIQAAHALIPMEVRRPTLGSGTRNKSKLARATSVAAFVTSGRVFIDGDGPWVNEFVDQLERFPHAKRDEWVDCFSQAIMWLVERELVAGEQTVLTAAMEGGYMDKVEGGERGPDSGFGDGAGFAGGGEPDAEAFDCGTGVGYYGGFGLDDPTGLW